MGVSRRRQGELKLFCFSVSDGLQLRHLGGNSGGGLGAANKEPLIFFPFSFLFCRVFLFFHRLSLQTKIEFIRRGQILGP